jgi:hypothetical protein
MFEAAPGTIQILVVRLLVATRNTHLQIECSVEYVRRLYIQPLCKSVCDSDFRVRHFIICNRGGPSRTPKRKLSQWPMEPGINEE